MDTKKPGFLTTEWLCAKAGRPSMAGSSVVQASLEAPYICSVLGPAYVMASGKRGAAPESPPWICLSLQGHEGALCTARYGC